MNLTDYLNFLIEKRIAIGLLESKRDELSSSIDSLKSDVVNLKEALEIVSIVGILAQDNVKNLIESLVTQALQSVFGDEYSFELDSRISRNRPEIEMFVVENGVRYSPKDEKGGGIIDVISFTLRVVIWAIQESRSQNTLVFDEPFRCMHKDTLEFLAMMMRQLSDMLGIQFIIITHENQLAISASRSDKDTSYYVRKVRGISEVEKLNERS